MNNNKILEINDLTVSFSMYKKGLSKQNLEVIHKLSLNVNKGEILAVVGSSGSGKSLLAHAILGILPENSNITGNMKYNGNLLSEGRKKAMCGKEFAFIPQSVSYLDPLMRIDRQVVGIGKNYNKQKELFERYDLDNDVGKMYPYQLSGGMTRRVLIASALMGNPEIIIADEPTPGLNIEMAMETLKHFRELADKGCSILLITHDIDLALNVADRIAVFYAGTVFEIAETKDFLAGRDELRHPYSKAFIEALPQNGFNSIKGFQPYAGDLPEGCLFAPRCELYTEECKQNILMREVRGGEVRCIHAT